MRTAGDDGIERAVLAEQKVSVGRVVDAHGRPVRGADGQPGIADLDVEVTLVAHE